MDLKLLIVDDEPFTREGLHEHFDWEAYGIGTVREADGGHAALATIEREKPDILITDVRMPDMNGLLLAKEIQERYPDIKVVIMSAYDEIGYVKQALKVSAQDYILKPVDIRELDNIMRRVTSMISRKNEERRRINEMGSRLIQSMPMLRERFLLQLVHDGVEGQGDIRKKAQFLELALPPDDDYCALAIHVDDRASTLDGLSERDKQLTSFAVVNVCDELVNRVFRGYTFESCPGEYVCLLDFSMRGVTDSALCESEENLYAVMVDIKDKLYECLELSVTIGVGPTVTGLAQVAKSYAKASQYVDWRFFLGKNRIITIDSLYDDESEAGEFDFARIGKVLNQMQGSDEAKLCDEIALFFAELTGCRHADIQYTVNICHQLVLAADRKMMELKIGTDTADFDRLGSAETLEEIKAVVQNHLVGYNRLINEKRMRQSTNVIERTKAVIEQSYGTNLSVRDIARKVYLNTTYLCMIFKQETGETVNDYLTRVRLERAKELLKNPYNRLYDICHEIGYADPGYFSKVFRKYTDMTPTEYRQSLL